MKRLIFFLLIGVTFFALSYEPKAQWRGMPAASDPIQTNERLPPAFLSEGDLITPLAHYSITAVVLSRERYRFDSGSRWAPLDLALGWGPMSVAGVINDLKISQGGRFYEYHWSGGSPIEPDQIVSHSANTHCLPANDDIRRRLLSVKRHQRVTLEGYLVEVAGKDGSHWRSSLTRDDSGAGACEVMWVTEVSTLTLH